MNKIQFIEWIKDLPDDFEVMPFEITEVDESHSPWEMDGKSVGTTFKTVYKKEVRTDMKFHVTFKGQVSAEFKRDQFGHEQWANFRRIK